MKIISILCTLLLMNSCFKSPVDSGKFRLPASTEKLDNLEAIITSLGDAVQTPVNSTTQCSSELKKYYQALFNLNGDNAELEKYSSKTLLKIVNTSFKTRLLIRDKLTDLRVITKADEDCLDNVRATIRALRYVEDYLVEIEESRNSNGLDKAYVTLSGEAPYFLKNSKFNFNGYKDLRGGDVILSRGNAWSSAAIARIGSSDAQFSHLTLVHEDESGKLFTSEAHIEIGSVGEPIETHIEQGNARTVVFRFKDPMIAKKAGEIMYKKVRSRQLQKNNIRYDFGMDYKDNSDLFCSEIIYDGFRQASDGELDIPVFKTRFNKGSIPFLQKLGIKVDQDNIEDFYTFGPGDIEFDPRFDLVAEWRNPARMQDTRTKDLILTKLFEWMETKDYQFRAAGKVKRKAWFSWLMRRTPFIGLALKGKFPKYMTREQLKLFIMLDKVSIVLLNRVDEVRTDLNRPMTPKEIFAILEQFREEDYRRFENRPKKSKFHRMFHP